MDRANGVRLAVDIGGTKVLCGLSRGDDTFFALSQFSVRREAGTVSVGGIVAGVSQFLKNSVGDVRNLQAIGIAVPGAVEDGCVRVAVNLGWYQVELREAFAKAFSVPVGVENDCTAAALGELHQAQAGPHRHLVYLAIGTGIGAGIIVDGKVYRGAIGRAGELGHTILNPNGPLCRCGSRGCFETLASGLALEERARDVWARDGTFDQKSIKATEVLRTDDERTREIVAEWMDWVAVGCINIVRALNPGKIVLGGGVGSQLEPWLPRLRDRIGDLMPTLIPEELAIEVSDLEDRASLVGADILAGVAMTSFDGVKGCPS